MSARNVWAEHDTTPAPPAHYNADEARAWTVGYEAGRHDKTACAECGLPGRYTLPTDDGTTVSLCASHRGLAPKFGAS